MSFIYIQQCILIKIIFYIDDIRSYYGDEIDIYSFVTYMLCHRKNSRFKSIKMGYVLAEYAENARSACLNINVLYLV